MANFNKVMLMGNLTRDPELRYTPNNMPVCQVGIAVNRQWTDRQTNERREETTFVDCDAFGRTAEVISQYLHKGRPIFIEGRLKLDQWQAQDGSNRSKLKVVIENFQFVDSRGGEGDGGSGGGGGGGYGQRGGGQRQPARSGPPASSPPSDMDSPHDAVGEEDIPF